ncbi:MAG: TonB-dependent receptor [Vicinamibacterales bacterium]
MVLADTTTQTQNVGNGRFGGFEFSVDAPVAPTLTVGGNYTLVHRKVTDALQPNLRPTGTPTHKAFLYASWQPLTVLRVTPSLDVAGDRWSDVNPAPAFPYVRTGAYTLLNADATFTVRPQLDLAVGGKNLTDDDYQLAWGFPQQGRTFYIKTRVTF